jgi:hypothetical protein
VILFDPEGVDPATLRRTISDWFRRPVPRFTLLCLALTAVVGLVDAITGRRLVLIGFLIIGPCMAVATWRWRSTVLVGLWSVALAILLGPLNGIWGTAVHLEYVAAVAIVAALSTGIAVFAKPVAYGSAGFVTTAYWGVLDRGPDPAGLRHHLEALRTGTTREQILLDIVESPEAVGRTLYRPAMRNLMGEFFRLRAEVDPALRPIAFLHTMKTAGTALSRALVELTVPWPILTDLMVDQFVGLPPPLIDRAMLITGHLPYETVELLPDGVALCTVIRDPVERTLSHHAHVNTMLAGRGEPQVEIEEFLTTARWRPMWENYHARQLVHRIGLAEAWTKFSPAQLAAAQGMGGSDAEFPLQSLFDSAPLTLTADELLGAALSRLDTFEFVGTTEDLDSLVAAIARFWNRPAPRPVSRARVSDGRVARDTLPTELLAAVQDGTAVDAALHERARHIAAGTNRAL